MHFKLSICIPTYNRANYLEEALNSILTQIDDSNRNDVEICVSDNASDDNTTEIVNRLKQRHPHFTYFRHEKNMGADSNYMKAVEIAKGAYCWLLGSDDIIFKNGIKTALAKIAEYKTDLFFVNSVMHDKNMQNPIKQGKGVQTEDLVYTDCEKTIKNMGTYFGYLSGIITNKDKWDRYSSEKKYIGSAYSHLYICWKIIKNSGSVCHIAPALVGYRGQNDSFLSSGYFNRVKIAIVAHSEIAAEVFGKASKEYVYINNVTVKYHVFNQVFIAILNKGASLKYRINVFLISFKYYKFYLFLWIKLFPLLFVPGFILRFIRFGYRKTLKKKKYIKNIE